jgi:hypothetical protein
MMNKKILALFLALITLLSISACAKNKYKPVPSTDEEKKTVFTLGEYEVPYELFRTFFLTDKEELDGGDKSVWIGSTAEEYREKAIELLRALEGIDVISADYLPENALYREFI